MWEFIVLGIIPGTQIRITFILWALVIIALSVGTIVWAAHRAHVVRDWVITARLIVLTYGQTIGRPE